MNKGYHKLNEEVLSSGGFFRFSQEEYPLAEIVRAERSENLTQEQKVSLKLAMALISEAGRLSRKFYEKDSLRKWFSGLDPSSVTFEVFLFLCCAFINEVKKSSSLGNSKLSDQALIETMVGPVVVGAEIADRFMPGKRVGEIVVDRCHFLSVDDGCVAFLRSLRFIEANGRPPLKGESDSLTFTVTEKISAILGVLNSYLEFEGKEKLKKIESMFFVLTGASDKCASYKQRAF